MLKVFGHVYSNFDEDFKVLKAALEEEGFELAYESTNNAAIIKEVLTDEEVVDE